MISVIVADNATSSLSATQSFSVVVREAIASLALSASTTNLLAGNTAALRFRLSANDALSNVTFQIEVPGGRLTNLALRALSPDVAGVWLTPLGADRYQARLAAGGTTPIGGQGDLAELSFRASPGIRSAVVPVKLSGVQALRLDGTPVPDWQAVSGRVFVIGEDPILEALLLTNRVRELMLYAQPGQNYGIEYKTNLQASAPWTLLGDFPMAQSWLEITNVGPYAPSIFYRAYRAAYPFKLYTTMVSNQVHLTLCGEPGKAYVVEYRTNLNAGSWQTLREVTLTNACEDIRPIGPSAPRLFYRAYDRVLGRTLQTRQQGNNLVIEWPTASAGCGLQETTSLTGTPVWVPSGATVLQTNGVIRATVPLGPGRKFYRLKCAP